MKLLRALIVSLLLLMVLPLGLYADDVVNSANVVIFAYFSEDSQESADEYFNAKYAQIKKFYDGDYKRSLKSYLNMVSYGKFNVINYFPQERDGRIVSLPLNMSVEEAKNGMVDGSIIHAICEYFNGQSLDNIDFNNDGYVDNISIILKAENVSSVASGTTLVPHSNTAGAINDESLFGLRVSNFNMLNTERMFGTSYFGEESGLIIHEYMHTLNYPDLYNANGDPLVGFWDIMASVSSRPSLPLAYLRNKISGWGNIDTITQSGSYTLEEQLSGNDIKAYVIASPLNENEEFVLEYRKTPVNRYDENALDADNVNDLGLIVYRIDKSTANDFYTNKGTNPGVYVLRPNNDDNLLKAALSLESGRTTTEGIMPLSFSDGSDSGIVISNVGSSKNDTITFNVTIPDNSQNDLWKSLNFPSGTNSSLNDITISYNNDSIYAVSYENKVFKTYRFVDNAWQIISSDISSNGYQSRKLFSHNNELYFLYTDYVSGLNIYKLTNDTWTKLGALSNATGFLDSTFINDDMYIVYSALDGAYYSVFSNNNFSNPVKYESTQKYFCGDTKIISLNNIPYLFVRNAIGNKLSGYKLENGILTKITDDTLVVNSYDVKSDGNTIYVSNSVSGKTLQVSKYSDGNWSTITSDISSFESTLSIHKGNMYVITSPDTGDGGYVQMYVYDEGSNKFVMEGDANIDSVSSKFTSIVLDNDIYLSYVRNSDNKTLVRRKTINSSNITKIDISNALINRDKDFTEDNPKVTVIYSGSTLTEGIDYIKSTSINNGRISVSIDGMGKYAGNVTKEYTSINVLTILCKDATYTGNEVYPEVTVTYGDKTLIKDKDYTFSYSNNVEVGDNAVVTVTGINDYYGSKDVKFEITNSIGESYASHSLSLNGLIELNMYFNLDSNLKDDNGAYALFILPDKREKKVFIKDAKYVEGRGYIFSCGLYAKEMNEEVTLKFVNSKGQESKEYKKSVKGYADAIFKKYEGSYGRDVQILKSMLNYGGNAQRYFNHNAGTPADIDVSLDFVEKMSSLKSNNLNKYDYSVTGTDSKVSFSSFTLVCEEATSFRLYFKFAGDKFVNEITPTINSKATTFKKSNLGYYVEISDIYSNKLDTNYIVQVGGITINCYPLSYCYLVLKKEASLQPKTVDLAKSIYLYFLDSKDRFG